MNTNGSILEKEPFKYDDVFIPKEIIGWNWGAAGLTWI